MEDDCPTEYWALWRMMDALHLLGLTSIMLVVLTSGQNRILGSRPDLDVDASRLGRGKHIHDQVFLNITYFDLFVRHFDHLSQENKTYQTNSHPS